MGGVKLSWVCYLNNKLLDNYIDVGWKLGLLVLVKLPLGEQSLSHQDLLSHSPKSQQLFQLVSGVLVAHIYLLGDIPFANLWDQIEALGERVKVQGGHIQQVKLEVDKKGVGDHSDLRNGQKFLQLGRLQKLNQLDAVIEEIREIMLKSADTVSKEKLNRQKEAIAAQRKQQQSGVDAKLQRLVWDPGGSEAHEQELMIFAAMEYDAGTSLHAAASQPATSARVHSSIEGRRNLISIFEFNVI
jgi:hypothetical protein